MGACLAPGIANAQQCLCTTGAMSIPGPSALRLLGTCAPYPGYWISSDGRVRHYGRRSRRRSLQSSLRDQLASENLDPVPGRIKPRLLSMFAGLTVIPHVYVAGVTPPSNPQPVVVLSRFIVPLDK